MSPALNESSMLERFKRRNAIEIRNEIMLDFYPGLPHMHNFVMVMWVMGQITHTHTFNVTVQYGVRVQVVHSLENLLEVVEALINWQWKTTTLIILQQAV